MECSNLHAPVFASVVLSIEPIPHLLSRKTGEDLACPGIKLLPQLQVFSLLMALAL